MTTQSNRSETVKVPSNQVVTIGEFAKKHPIFYSPVILMSGLMIGFALCSFGDALHNIVAKVVLNVVGLLILLAFGVLAVCILFVLGKSIAEDKRN